MDRVLSLLIYVITAFARLSKWLAKIANGLTLFLCEAAGIMKSQNKPCLAYGSEVG